MKRPRNNPPKSGTKRPISERNAPERSRHPGNRNTTDSGVLFCLFANCFPMAGRLILETVSHGPCADCKNSNFPNNFPAVLIPATSRFPAANGSQITGKFSAKFFRRLLCTRACGTAQNSLPARLLLQRFTQPVYGLVVPAPGGAVRHR